MKRTRYRVLDHDGAVRATVVLPEGEPLRLEPWLLHNVNVRGWYVTSQEEKESGVEVHGWADWRSVADNLATVLRALLDDSVELGPEETVQLFDQAQVALDDYQTSVMEVGLAHPASPEDEEGEDGSPEPQRT